MKYIILNPKTPEDIVLNAEKKGFKVVMADYISGIDSSVAGHPDMHLVKIGNTLVVNPGSYAYYKKQMPDIDIVCGKTVVQGKYPEYTAYNIALLGSFALHNFKYTDSVALSLIEKGYKKINVNQGYTKCSVVALPDSIITADKGIISSAVSAGIKCLEITSGYVKLECKEYGFLGGATGFYNGTLYVAGDLKNHPDYIKIENFCKEKCIEICCLSNDKLADIGSIIIV